MRATSQCSLKWQTSLKTQFQSDKGTLIWVRARGFGNIVSSNNYIILREVKQYHEMATLNMQCVHFMHSCMQRKCLCKCCLKVCRRSHKDKTQVLKFTLKCQSILLHTKEASPHTLQHASACEAWVLFKRNKESCPFLVPRQFCDEEISTS